MFETLDFFFLTDDILLYHAININAHDIVTGIFRMHMDFAMSHAIDANNNNNYLKTYGHAEHCSLHFCLHANACPYTKVENS